MRISSVSAVDPTTTGTPVNDRAAIDRDRARDDRQRLEEQTRVQPSPAPGTGTQVDRRA
jgi:hypothetical protein